MQNRSKLKLPIILLEEFLSPLKCQSDDVLSVTEQKLKSIVPLIDKQYGVKVKSFDCKLMTPPNVLHCGSAIFKSRWVKINDADFIGYLPLKDHSTSPFDENTDVYGGALVLRQYNTKLLPNAGTLFIHPATPNFAQYFEEVHAGVLNYVFIQIKCESNYEFDFTKWSSNWSF